MSDPGFPPFRSAQPKGTAKPAPAKMAQDDNMEMISAQAATHETARPDTPEVNYQPQHITVCAKCGSREVREAVLIGNEVYVKL